MSVYKDPEEDLTIPVPKEDKVVEPLLATVNWDTPEEEAAIKIAVLGRVEVPWTDRVAIGEEEPMPTKPLALTVR